MGTNIKKVTVMAPAKLNLALAVTGLNEKGYHTLDMIMQAVNLYERVEVAKSSGYSLRCPGSHIPANDKNTATKAAAAFFTETGLLAGADITVHKTVPTRAGLAGGSADAAAVLVALNELYGARLTLPHLAEIGALVGADVPFSLYGGTARVRGIGDDITPLSALTTGWFTIAMPEVGVSTPAAFARYDELGSPLQPNIDAAEQAVRQNHLPALAAAMQNALEYANGGESTPLLRKTLDDAGALGSMMTGSGAAVFGLFANEAAARKAAEHLHPIASQVFVVQPQSGGPKITQRI